MNTTEMATQRKTPVPESHLDIGWRDRMGERPIQSEVLCKPEGAVHGTSGSSISKPRFRNDPGNAQQPCSTRLLETGDGVLLTFVAEKATVLVPLG